jgi:hypothetical protein
MYHPTSSSEQKRETSLSSQNSVQIDIRSSLESIIRMQQNAPSAHHLHLTSPLGRHCLYSSTRNDWPKIHSVVCSTEKHSRSVSHSRCGTHTEHHHAILLQDTERPRTYYGSYSCAFEERRALCWTKWRRTRRMWLLLLLRATN